jgi:hypothetical protein
MREELRACMANLANSPLLEARVCQYEDTRQEHADRPQPGGSERVVRRRRFRSRRVRRTTHLGEAAAEGPVPALQKQRHKERDFLEGLFELRGSLVRFTHSSLTTSQASQYKVDRGHLDEGFACLHPALVVLTQAAVSYQPRKSSLYYPPLRQDLEKPLACGFRSTISSSHPPYSSHQLANSSPP